MQRIALSALIALILLANLGLWTSDDVPAELKRDLTILNVLGWAVVLLPAWGVSMWLRARKKHRGD